VLAEVKIPAPPSVNSVPRPPGGWLEWRGYRLYDEKGYVEVAVPGLPAGRTRKYQYGVWLDGAEFGTMLGCMPTEAVPDVIDAFLRAAAPELLGAVAGRIIAHVAAVAASRQGEEPG
jgi:hypothetical protein